MAYTQADLDAIDRAIKAGVDTVSYDGKLTKFRSLAEMQSIRAVIAADVAAAAATEPVRQVYATTSKGL